MKRYLVWQTQMVRNGFNGTSNEVIIDVVIRNVGAENEAEAIGKFLLETADINPKAIQKLTPLYSELEELIKID